MKKLISLIVLAAIFFSFSTVSFAESSTKSMAETEITDNQNFSVNAKSALLMEAESGKIIFAQNENSKASPASVTKIMTLLLVSEAIRDEKIKLSDLVSVSEYASSMGGSQVFLEAGERMSVEELLKCTIIASANDAAVALSEYVAGTEGAFVSLMNEKARALGMTNTHFENVTGLDDTTENHLTCALDIAIMSQELIKHDIIKKYASVWQDTIRNGEFTLTNTNRLVRFYDGCNGLKTGSTDKAGYCISATAERGGMQLIAVIMGAETRDIRNAAAKSLLDFGFSNYALYEQNEGVLEKIPVSFGLKDEAELCTKGVKILVSKGDLKKVNIKYDIPDKITAPFKKGDVVGKMYFYIGNEKIGESDVYVNETVKSISFFEVFIRLIKNILMP